MASNPPPAKIELALALALVPIAPICHAFNVLGTFNYTYWSFVSLYGVWFGGAFAIAYALYLFEVRTPTRGERRALYAVIISTASFLIGIVLIQFIADVIWFQGHRS